MKIRAIEAIPVRIPRERTAAVGTAGSPTALDATPGEYRWSSVFPALYAVNFETALVRVTLDDGRHGWGEAQAPLAPEVACTIVERLLAPVLINVAFDGTLENIQALWDQMYSTMRVRGQTGGFMLDAISGIDLALWDLAGKVQEKPVCALIPASLNRTRVRAYCSGILGGSIAQRIEYALARRAEGFGAFKLFYDCRREEFLRLLSELRGALGPSTALAVDALWRLTPENGVDFGLELDRQNALWLEAPLPPEDPLAHARLAVQIRTPLALGESYRTRFELAPFFNSRCMRYVQPDLGRSGLTEGLHIARIAAGLGMSVAPHVSIAMGPQIAAAIHMAAAIPNCDFLEYNPNVFDIANGHLAEPLQFLNASYRVPQAPGLGCDVRFC